MSNFLRISMAFAPAALLSLIAIGCSQTAIRGKNAATAPGLSGEGQAHIRGVSDPNAPFTLVDRTKSNAGATMTGEENLSAPCDASTLQAYEAAASMDGDSRVVRLAFKNRGTAACRLSGYPVISLQDQSGVPVASIAIRQVSSSTLTGTVTAPVKDASAEAAANQPVEILLRPSTTASFEIGWTTGETCALVSRFTVAVPRTESASEANTPFSGVFTINHPLNVCNGEVKMTALTSGSSI